nr:MAG TPA: hypothetical protein [Caudoviricetes sp.]DAS49160.1 MAG TPA: hypothetical protein [Caudoviricetes sp.]
MDVPLSAYRKRTSYPDYLIENERRCLQWRKA